MERKGGDKPRQSGGRARQSGKSPGLSHRGFDKPRTDSRRPAGNTRGRFRPPLRETAPVAELPRMENTLRDLDTLRRFLPLLEGRHAGSYAGLAGEYDYGDFMLIVDYIPDDPSRQPARLRARVKRETARFPHDVFNTRSREIGARDFLARAFSYAAGRAPADRWGERSSRIAIDRPGRELLETSAVVVGDDAIEARFTVELPIRRDRIPADMASQLFLSTIPAAIRSSLFFKNVDGQGLADSIASS